MLFGACLGLLGCGGGSRRGQVVIVDGSSTVYPISVAAQEAYTETLETVPRIVVETHGTGGGFGRYNEGEVDLIGASRPAKPEEEQQAKQRGYDWTRFIVGHDGITVAVHPSNDFVESLTVDQLRAIFRPDSKVRTWKDLDPDWPDAEITLYTPDDDSGTFDFFVQEALGLQTQRTEGVQPSADDNVLVTGIAGDEHALGYFGYAYYAAHREKLRAVPIRADEEAEAVLPSPETIGSGAYRPLSRPLYIYVKNSAMERPEVADFVTYYIEHAGELAERVDYVPPSSEEHAANLETLQTLLGGGAVAETAAAEAS